MRDTLQGMGTLTQIFIFFVAALVLVSSSSVVSVRTAKLFFTGTAVCLQAVGVELTAEVLGSPAEPGSNNCCKAALDIGRAGPATCQSPGICGPGVVAVGPCPPRRPPPDRQFVRPRGEATGVEASSASPAAPAAFGRFAAATDLG